MKLSKIAGSGFRLLSFSGTLQVASGASGDILTLTPAANKKIKLAGLVAASAESGISVYRGTTKVINNKALQSAAQAATVGGFIVGLGMASGSAAGGGTQTLDEVQGEVNEVIRVVKETGSTAAIVYYSFCEGE